MESVSHSHARHVSRGPKVAVVCDPEGASAEIAEHLCRELPARMTELHGSAASFDMYMHRERLPIGKQGGQQALVKHAEVMKRQRGWDAAVCVTDLPLCGENSEPLVADVSVDSRVALLSLPAFGAPRLRRRVTQVTAHVLRELFPADHEQVPFTRGDLPKPFRLIRPESREIDAQVVSTRGLWRQLAGMVRDNRPWRLLLGLRRGVVAALAFSVLLLINPTVWQLGIGQSSYRLLTISLCVIAAMVAWLIFYHHLWVFGDGPEERRRIFLFNASTVLSFAFGLSFAFIALGVVNFVGARMLLSDSVLAHQFGSPPGIIDYVKLSWMSTAGASVVGALGTGFESEDDVREAAYSQREAERGKEWR